MTPAKRISIKARTTENQLIEAFQEDVEAGDATYVYNVAGAAPLGTHSVYYGEEGSADPATTLGALRWLRTTADYVLTDPPQSLSMSKGERRTRVVLDAGQTRLAENVRRWLPEARAAAAVIRVHARWDAADSPDILTWLSSAALGEPDAHILEARLKDNPGEVVSLRTQQDAAKGDGHSAICEHDAERARAAAGNADLQYLAARCNSTGEARDRAFVEGWQKWPGNGWFANAAGYALADHGAYDQALAALQVAWRNAPPVASSAAVLAARIRRMQARSVDADVRDLAAVSPELRDLLQTETGVDQAGPARAYASLGQGRLQEALAAAKGSPFENRLVRLVAASDGAPPDALQRIAALPAADNPYDTWIDGALALRRGLDFTPYQKAIRTSLGDSGKALAPFVELVRTRQIPAANDQLKTLPLDLRLKASVFGTIALMERAPRDWRESAYYMLFPPERPYLRLEFNSQGARAH